jgi:hypothetical protein
VPVPTLPPGTSVQLSGTWPLRPISTADASGTIAWNLPVTESGTYEISIRTPGPGKTPYANNACLKVAVPGAKSYSILCRGLIEIDLTSNTQQWRTVCTIVVNLNGNAPCAAYVQLGADPTRAMNMNLPLNNQITFFEARLVPTARSIGP